jgi:hypothetical protein
MIGIKVTIAKIRLSYRTDMIGPPGWRVIPAAVSAWEGKRHGPKRRRSFSSFRSHFAVPSERL